MEEGKRKANCSNFSTLWNAAGKERGTVLSGVTLKAVLIKGQCQLSKFLVVMDVQEIVFFMLPQSYP